MSVGLMGGSFNPAHDGHRHISLHALKRLRLDAVWWLVSPQNPLKTAGDMAPLAARLTGARAVARHPRIIATAIETDLGTRYTVDTLTALGQRFPRTRFTWLMGADNLAQFPAWKDWTGIMSIVPVAILDRPGYTGRALGGKMVQRYARYRRRAGRGFARRESLPAWTFLDLPRHAASATEIRARSRE